MKVLVVSHHRENSGWGRACRDFIKCLSQQTDVVAKPVILGSNYKDPEISKLENKSLNKITHVIQYLLPHHMSYIGGFDKCVGISLFETSLPKTHSFMKYISLNDEFWNFGNTQIENSINLFQSYQPFNGLQPIKIKEAEGLYKFLFVGEAIKRKNIHGLITAYYNMNKGTPAVLILKTNVPGLNPQEARQYINQIIDQVQRGCRIYSSP